MKLGWFFGGTLPHALFGFLGAVSTTLPLGWALLFANLLIFTIYEMDQDWRKDDWLDEEFREYGAGFALGVVLLLAFAWL